MMSSAVDMRCMSSKASDSLLSFGDNKIWCKYGESTPVIRTSATRYWNYPSFYVWLLVKMAWSKAELTGLPFGATGMLRCCSKGSWQYNRSSRLPFWLCIPIRAVSVLIWRTWSCSSHSRSLKWSSLAPSVAESLIWFGVSEIIWLMNYDLGATPLSRKGVSSARSALMFKNY